MTKKPDITAEIICVGSELLLGHIVNTNASYLSRKLACEGINLFRQSVIGDNPVRLSRAIKDALRRADILIISGGLGPTVDDITIAAVAKTISRPLVLNKAILRSVKEHFRKRHIKMLLYNKKQAYVPKGALAIKNPVGTAPASIIEYGDKTIVALPGPPRELTPIFEDAVIPYFRKRYKIDSTIFTRTIRTTGLPESTVNKKVRSFLLMKGAITAGIYARLGEVDIKITAKAENKKNAVMQIKKVENRLIRKLGNNVYGFDNDTLESVVGKLLAKRKMALSIAESCTGGLIANRITNIPGSSKYFKLGEVVYSNSSKASELGVSSEKIKKHGAVSREVAVAMAKGVLKKSKANISLAVTGIAGPTGGTKEKPVGLVYIALTLKNKTVCIKRYFLGTREEIKLQISNAALDLVRKELLG